MDLVYFDPMHHNRQNHHQISHRLSSTRFCDTIAFFENGEILEYGTHEELLAKKGRYAEMFNIQAQYYQLESVEEMAACAN